MIGPTIKLNKSLWIRVKKCAEAGGYSSPQELVEHLLEKELAKIDTEVSDEEITKKLQGLGYLE